ncbi:hypothetical protein ES288_A11G212400v1 [Gossypium darwinii]|uniref:Uncharacterized protein n=1 Tax=Gossypium darwinii TaxID=34276 RepID=A0A5D2ENK9_GOSDA|nr:hypothetical protein ES288_A11G212400v1 [Gossypium darwinii]
MNGIEPSNGVSVMQLHFLLTSHPFLPIRGNGMVENDVVRGCERGTERGGHGTCGG